MTYCIITSVVIHPWHHSLALHLVPATALCEPGAAPLRAKLHVVRTAIDNVRGCSKHHNLMMCFYDEKMPTLPVTPLIRA